MNLDRSQGDRNLLARLLMVVAVATSALIAALFLTQFMLTPPRRDLVELGVYLAVSGGGSFLVGWGEILVLERRLAYGLLRSSESGSAVDAEGRTVATGPIDTPDSSPRESSVAPDFVLADYNGRAVQRSDFRGKIVLLNFWAMWCTTCAAEMPDMQRLAEENPAQLVVLAVNQAEPAGRAQSWSDARGLTAFTFALDQDKDVTDAYKLPSGLPHSFFIDASGVVRAVKHGGMDYDEMKRLLEETRAAAP